MALTPEDVASKQFTSSRLGQRGYSEAEVDDFLDEVEAELTRLTRENEQLRTRLAAAGTAPAAADGAANGAGAKTPAGPSAVTAPASAAVPAPGPTQAPEVQATGILALAQRTADQHIATASAEAERVLGEARTRAEQMDVKAQENYRKTLGPLEEERASLERRVEGLRGFERDYRARLKSYLEGQLRDLAGTSLDGGPGPAGDAGSGPAANGAAPTQPAPARATGGSTAAPTTPPPAAPQQGPRPGSR